LENTETQTELFKAAENLAAFLKDKVPEGENKKVAMVCFHNCIRWANEGIKND